MPQEQVHAAARRLASRRAERGVGPGHVIGRCAERGRPRPIGLLAIVRTGAAYLPFDPQYPTQRIRFMVIDATPGLGSVHIDFLWACQACSAASGTRACRTTPTPTATRTPSSDTLRTTGPTGGSASGGAPQPAAHEPMRLDRPTVDIRWRVTSSSSQQAQRMHAHA
ncbi:AMP-binding protein [Dactylosporangium vinaceum]|nr:AMP-binding protein [Dactylosporangium vinaceum]